jgi:hypothetical protein
VCENSKDNSVDSDYWRFATMRPTPSFYGSKSLRYGSGAWKLAPLKRQNWPSAPIFPPVEEAAGR